MVLAVWEGPRIAETRVERILRSMSGPDPVALGRLCEACVEELDVTGAGLVLVIGGEHRGTLASSDPRAARLSDLAFTTGEAPCLDAHRSAAPVLVPDLAADGRWPGYCREAVSEGVAAVFALPMRSGEIGYGTLDLYRDTPGGLAPDQLQDATQVADVAAAFVVAVQAQASPGAIAGLIGDAADHRVVVHQATGRIAVQLDVDIDAALAALRARAFAEDRSVDAVAADVVAGRVSFRGGAV